MGRQKDGDRRLKERKGRIGRSRSPGNMLIGGWGGGQEKQRACKNLSRDIGGTAHEQVSLVESGRWK